MISKLFNRETISYGICGLITTLLHFLLFYVFINIGIKYYFANVFVLIVIKVIAYFLNKFFVFRSKCDNKKELFNEVIKYIFSRFITMLIDYFGLILLVEVFNIKELFGKAIVLIIVVIINYFMCKDYVYKKGDAFC